MPIVGRRLVVLEGDLVELAQGAEQLAERRGRPESVGLDAGELTARFAQCSQRVLS